MLDWVRQRNDERRIDAEQKQFLGPLVEVTRGDHVRNENIRRKIGEDSVGHGIGKCCRKWKEHMQRTPADHTARAARFLEDKEAWEAPRKNR
jgi:hypothetical protein